MEPEQAAAHTGLVVQMKEGLSWATACSLWCPALCGCRREECRACPACGTALATAAELELHPSQLRALEGDGNLLVGEGKSISLC